MKAISWTTTRLQLNSSLKSNWDQSKMENEWSKTRRRSKYKPYEEKNNRRRRTATKCDETKRWKNYQLKNCALWICNITVLWDCSNQWISCQIDGKGSRSICGFQSTNSRKNCEGQRSTDQPAIAKIYAKDWFVSKWRSLVVRTKPWKIYVWRRR